MTEDLMTAADIAARLGLAEDTVRQWRLHVCGRRGNAYLYSFEDAEERWAARTLRRRLLPWERTGGKRLPRKARR